MASGKPQWYRGDPSADHYLLPEAFDHRRPIAQGDVFADIPFPLVKHPGDEASERRRPDFARVPLQEPLALSPDVNPIRARMGLKLKFGMVLPHTCEYYEMQAGPANRIRVLALVRERSQERIPDDWNGAFNIFPLPNLFNDGRYFLAQLDTVVTVEEAFLAKDSRRACLSFEGWLSLQQRLAHYFSRFQAPWTDLEELQRPYWQEIAQDEQRLADEVGQTQGFE